MHTLVVAATAAEAAHVPADLPLVVTGMGKTAAAVATTRALAAYNDVSRLTVVNIGTAGALRDGLSGLYEPGRCSTATSTPTSSARSATTPRSG